LLSTIAFSRGGLSAAMAYTLQYFQNNSRYCPSVHISSLCRCLGINGCVKAVLNCNQPHLSDGPLTRLTVWPWKLHGLNAAESGVRYIIYLVESLVHRKSTRWRTQYLENSGTTTQGNSVSTRPTLQCQRRDLQQGGSIETRTDPTREASAENPCRLA
jgi:hypothetical protein